VILGLDELISEFSSKVGVDTACNAFGVKRPFLPAQAAESRWEAASQETQGEDQPQGASSGVISG